MPFQSFKGFSIHYLLKFLLSRDRQLKWGLFLSLNLMTARRLHGEIHAWNNKITIPRSSLRQCLCHVWKSHCNWQVRPFVQNIGVFILKENKWTGKKQLSVTGAKEKFLGSTESAWKHLHNNHRVVFYMWKAWLIPCEKSLAYLDDVFALATWFGVHTLKYSYFWMSWIQQAVSDSALLVLD